MHQHGIHYAAVITAAAALSAVFAAVVASKKAYQLETARDTESKRIAKFSQAIQISGWVRGKVTEKKQPNGFSLYLPSVVAVVKNPSLQPIFNVQMLWRYKGDSLSTDHVEVIPPEDSYKSFDIPSQHLSKLNADGFTVGSDVFASLPEAEDFVTRYVTESGSVNWSQFFHESASAAKVSEVLATQFKMIFTFEDSLGRSWQRGEDGILTEKNATGGES